MNHSVFYLIARDGSRLLQKLSTDQRQAIIIQMASNITDYSKDILQANRRDLEEANKRGLREKMKFSEVKCVFIEGLKASLMARLDLSEKKLQTLSNGLQQIAEKANALGLFQLFLSKFLISIY